MHSLWRAQPCHLLKTQLFHLPRRAWQWERSHCTYVSLSNQQGTLQHAEAWASPRLLSPAVWSSHLSLLLFQPLGPYLVKGWVLCLWIHSAALGRYPWLANSFSSSPALFPWTVKITGDTSFCSLNPVPTHTVNTKVKTLCPRINGLEPLSPLSFSMLRLLWKDYHN